MITDRQLFLSYLAQTSESPIGIEVERAEGIYVFSPDGKKYMDLISGISVSNTGHRHPKVIEAIRQQLDRYLHLMVYGEYIQSPQVKLAAKLAEVLPPELQSTYFVNSGSEAVEGALKLSKRFTGRHKIVSYRNAYHGGTHGSLSIMGDETLKKPFYPLLPDIIQIELNDSEGLEKITNECACVIIEPIQGEAGIFASTPEYLKALRERCTETGALLIFDEIQSGFGRTGQLFAFQGYDVIPDILVLAKGMGGGLPIGAFISSREIMSSLSHDPILGHITTFGGNPVCCAASLANLNVILEEKLAEQVKGKSGLFRELLSGLPGVLDYRSSGLLIAVELKDFNSVKKVIDLNLEKGVITDWFLFNSSSIRIAPPLTITNQEITSACSIIAESIKQAV
ncbi:MAG: aspartate aminotransferase family protein [Bacteroidetes bacterium]|nr:aspartate aminotransferase family protein [Bacteroidota bacterium]